MLKSQFFSLVDIIIMYNAIAGSGMNRILTTLLAEFQHSDSGSLYTLFKTYCMNIIIWNVKCGDIIRNKKVFILLGARLSFIIQLPIIHCIIVTP